MRTELENAGAPDPVLTDSEFSRLTEILTDRIGVLFPEHKRREFQTKLSPYLESLDGTSRSRLIEKAEDNDASFQELVNRLTIGESYFFRNRPHFNALEERILPSLIEANSSSKRLRIWCAGCSTGEEPYSLSILIRERFPQLSGWDISITGTDINTSFLDRARAGVYTSWSFRSVEPHIIERYFHQESANRFVLDRRIAETVDFEIFNLSTPPFKGRMDGAPFDLVMCRNVLIYFSYDSSNEVVRALKETLVPGGYLLVGHAESFPALRELEAIYAHATYYYRKTGGSIPPPPQGPVHTLTIPGIAVHDVDKRQTIAPRPSTPDGVAEPTPSAREPVRPAEEPPQIDELAVALEEAQDHTDMGELDKAREILDRLVTGAGKLDHRVHFLRALVADQENRIQEALSCLKQAIFLKKNFAIGHYYHGVICEREGDRKNALRFFKNVDSITGEMPDEHELDEGGGITAGVLGEIARERTKEVALEEKGAV